MANKFKGEATLERSQEDGGNVIFLFDANTLCDLEEELERSTGEPVGLQDIVDMMGDETRVSMRQMRLLIQCATKRHHSLSSEEAGDLISEVGPEAVMECLMKAMNQAMPKAQPGNPRKPPAVKQAGTGK